MPKYLLLVVISLLSVSSSSIQKIKTFVYDYEGVLSMPEKNTLDSLFRQHEKKTNNEVVLLTTPDFGKYQNIDDYSLATGNKMGIGKAEKDNGVLIVFSQAQREARISTGLGTEEILTDSIAVEIMFNIMIPRFKEGKMFEGIFSGSKAITDFLEKPENEIR